MSKPEILDFLFCQKCDKHVNGNFFFGDYEVDIDKTKMSDEDRKNRVAPVVNVKAKPFCSFCGGPLIQKWVEVVVNIEA